MSSMFKTPAAKDVVSGWYDRFLARLKTPTESRVVQTSFGEAHVRVGGPVDAPSLVIFHGAMASSAHALVELEGLLRHFRVYAVDVVGQSVKSADQRPSVKDDSYGRWAAEVLTGLGLEKTFVVGISWGGFVSIRLAAIAPERIARLALLVPAGMVTGPMVAGFLKIGWPMTKYVMAPNRARLEQFTSALLTTPDEEWMQFLGDAFRSYDMQGMKIPTLAKDGELARFTAPTLVMGADRDLSFPGEKLLARAKVLFPGLCDTELIKDCNHCPPTTDPFRAWLAERITAFLLAERRDTAAA